MAFCRIDTQARNAVAPLNRSQRLWFFILTLVLVSVS
jgi:hypothetical protein